MIENEIQYSITLEQVKKFKHSITVLVNEIYWKKKEKEALEEMLADLQNQLQDYKNKVGLEKES